MRMSGAFLVLMGALLTACGGGSADMRSQQAGSGPVSANPTPGGPAIGAFADMAHKAICTDFKNRLYVIDGKQVFWDRAGNCADMSYQQVLYGASPQEALCSRADSIAGPQTACKDESARPLFETILKNLAKDDLGIASSHTVERISLLVPSGTDVAFKVVDSTNNSSIHTARNVVVKDAGAWAALWAEHVGTFGTPRPLPAVDFSTSMVVGVFLGQRPSGCNSTGITKVTRNADGIAVQHTDTVPGVDVVCTANVPTPAALAVIDRSDLPVEFTAKIVPNR